MFETPPCNEIRFNRTDSKIPPNKVHPFQTHPNVGQWKISGMIPKIALKPNKAKLISWKDADYKKYFDHLADAMDIGPIEDWYVLTKHHLQHDISLFPQLNPISKALANAYPETSWQVWKFEHSPFERVWDKLETQEMYFEWLSDQLHVIQVQDWYKLSKMELERHGGSGLLCLHNNSPYHALRYVYPNVEWQPWRFERCPVGFWDALENQRQFLDWVGKELGFVHMEDWYRVSKADIEALGGSRLLVLHEDSPGKAIAAVYSEIQWQPWRFERVAAGYWDDPNNQRGYFDWIAEQLGVDDWYHVTTEDICLHGGSGVMEHFDNSISRALSAVYVDTEWQPWRFDRTRRNFWDEELNHDQYVEWLEYQGHMAAPEEWDIVYHSPESNGYEGSAATQLLQLKEMDVPSPPQYKVQHFLYKVVRDALPSEIEVEWEAGISNLKFPNRHKMLFDVWIPSLNTAIEYQGIQHYTDNHFVQVVDGLDRQVECDEYKQSACSHVDISVHCIPYWWNFDIKNFVQKLFL